MAESPTTRATLLLRVRDSRDKDAWAQFVAIYAPLIFAFARKKGLQDADAADVTQDVLNSVAGAMPRLEYDPDRGSFRGWLLTVVRNKLRDFHERRHIPAAGDTDAIRRLQEHPAPQFDEDALWRQEYRQRLFGWAADHVRPTVEESTWQAFWQTAVEGKKASEVGRNLGLSVAAVYMAKSRVLTRIKEHIETVQGESDHD
jgi:RNA polymerase sigma-70 factor (ECF subfamily)